MRWVLLAVVLALRQDASPDDVRRWVRDLGADDPDVREKATEALKRAGESALPLLREALKSEDLEVRARAELAMAHIEFGRFVLPNIEGQVAFQLGKLNSSDPSERLEALQAILAVAVPPEILNRFAKDSDPAVRNAARMACFSCPSRRVGEALLDFVASVGNDRGRLDDVLVNADFYSHFDVRHRERADAMMKSDVAETRIAGTLIRAAIEGKATPGVRALLGGGDAWAATVAVSFAPILGDDALADDVAALLGGGTVGDDVVTNALKLMSGPKAILHLVDDFKRQVDAKRLTNPPFMIQLGHIEAFDAAPIMLEALEKGLDNGSVVHALTDLEYQPAAPALLRLYRDGTGLELASNYVANMSSPEFAREGFEALKRQNAVHGTGESNVGDPTFISALAEMNARDKAQPAIECLDPSLPADVRSYAMATLSETILPEVFEKRLAGALDAMLSRDDEPLQLEAARAAAFHGLPWRDDWKPLEKKARDAPTAELLVILARLKAPAAADLARAQLTAGTDDLREVAFEALTLCGGASDVAAALAATRDAHDRSFSSALDVIARHGTPEQIVEAIRLIAPEGQTALNPTGKELEFLTRVQTPAALDALVRTVRDAGSFPDDVVAFLARRDPARTRDALRPLPADPARRWPRLRALADLGDEGVAPELAEALGSPDDSVVLEAMEALGRLKWKTAAPLLRRFVQYGRPAEVAASARALASIEGDAALPFLRSMAEDRTDPSPILLAMIRAGDKGALGLALRHARPKDNHYETALAALNDLDEAVNARAYADAARPADPGRGTMQYGVYLRRIEQAYGVSIRLSSGLDKLKQYYDSINCAGRFSSLLLALEARSNKWDANVVHVHMGDHILLCQPTEAFAYWKKRAEDER